MEGINLAQTVAVGDGANDLPMITLAGLGIAYRAKPKVKAGARQSISSIGLDGILYFLYLSDVNALHVCNLTDNVGDSYRISGYPLSAELRRSIYLSALNGD